MRKPFAQCINRMTAALDSAMRPMPAVWAWRGVKKNRYPNLEGNMDNEEFANQLITVLKGTYFSTSEDFHTSASSSFLSDGGIIIEIIGSCYGVHRERRARWKLEVLRERARDPDGAIPGFSSDKSQDRQGHNRTIHPGKNDHAHGHGQEAFRRSRVLRRGALSGGEKHQGCNKHHEFSFRAGSGLKLLVDKKQKTQPYW